MINKSIVRGVKEDNNVKVMFRNMLYMFISSLYHMYIAEFSAEVVILDMLYMSIFILLLNVSAKVMMLDMLYMSIFILSLYGKSQC